MLFLSIETKDFITTKNACLMVKVRGMLGKILIYSAVIKFFSFHNSRTDTLRRFLIYCT